MIPRPTARQSAVLIATALLAAPVALAAPIDLGERNPSGGRDATAETQIIADTARGSYGTRQSNKGEGGGAIYGCRAGLDNQRPTDPDASTPCVRVNNLSRGKAFDFVFNTGPLGGLIQSGADIRRANPNAAPFITNATAVAAGLNADRVDGRHASDLIAEARKQAGLDAEKVGGLTAAQIVENARTGVGTCAADSVRAGATCIERAPRAAASFADAAATCGAAGRSLAGAAVLLYARTLDGIDLGTGEMAADVTASQSIPLPDPLGSATSQTTYATVADDGAIDSAPVASATAFRCAGG